jgi:hypothetical protein
MGLVVTALLLFASLGCGGASRVSPTASLSAISHMAATKPPLERKYRHPDYDGDPHADPDVPVGLYDLDDKPVTYYGHTADTVNRRTITGLVRHYYAAISSGDGARACGLLETKLAKTLAPDPAAPRATGGCAAVIPTLFKNIPGRPLVDFARIAVIGVRLKDDKALALLRLPSGELGYLPLGHENGAWKVDALLDTQTE